MIRIGDGDRTAYKMLVDRHLRTFMAFTTRIIKDRVGAEDVMQEAFIRVWNNASKWDQGRNTKFTTWFYRIVMNLCIDVKRKRQPVSELSEAQNIMSDEPQPDVNLSEKQMALEVENGLSQLPDRQRIAMTLCYLQGIGNKDAAEVMGISLGAIESLLVRGRSKMAEILKSQKEELLKEKLL